jgi:hypothetical protein
MKFELTNSRHKISDIEYINDLRNVANNLGKDSLKQRDYCKNNGAKFNVKSAINRFKSWDNTLKMAGLKGEKSLKGMEYGEKSIKDEVLLADLVSVAKELNNPNISINEYKKYGKYTHVTMGARFGSWNQAKEKANLIVVNKRDISNKDLFNNIFELWTHFGRQPKYGEVISPLSEFHGSNYAKRFGSWQLALEAFVDYINNIEDDSEMTEVEESQLIAINPTPKESKSVEKIKIKKTSRTINLRLRFMILQRDNFTCKKCGQSPAKNPNIILHVDHIIPWSKGGETVIENLETLCKECNLGKSNVF